MFQVNDVDVRLLRVFVTVVEFGGYSAAQTELNISQSTLSNHMTALEERLGFRLCHRGRGGFRLTQKGEAIYQEARQLFTALGNFSAAAGALRGKLTGMLNIGVVDATITNARAPLPRVIRRFNENENEVHINLFVQSREELERSVLNGELHAAVGPFSRRLAGIHLYPLYTETQAVYCAPGHLFYDDCPGGISHEAISTAAFVARGYMRNFDSERLGGGRHCATVMNMEAQMILITSGGYIGFLPVHYAENRTPRQPELRQIRPELLSYDSEFSLIIRRGRLASNVLGKFLDAVADEFQITTLCSHARDTQVADRLP